ncbi:hypothetical protein JKP88DRAFT_253976 [Tribonema minus]|uniref:Uncharacterized protein n=1 Tax=Tribonema minus TaxID=303371 RepID=A0A835Z5Y2_9STRA|nr:hypothetical protein JKP88DRAFT_253976 [Tribonema minus]
MTTNYRAAAACATERCAEGLYLRWSLALRVTSRSPPVLLAADVAEHQRERPGERYYMQDYRRDFQVRPLALAAIGLLAMRSKLYHALPLYLAPRVHYSRTLADLDDTQCYNWLRLRRPDFARLKKALRLPEDFIVTENRSVYPTDEALMIFLSRLTTPSRLTDLIEFWGRDHTQISRVVKWMVAYIFEKFGPVLRVSLKVWVDDFPRYAAKIATKCQNLDDAMIRIS